MVPRWLLIVGLFILMVLPVSVGVAVAQEPDLEALRTEGVAVHKSDLEAWRWYSFRREVRRERLDSKGEVDWSLEFTLFNAPTESGFDEELIEVEGRAPTRSKSTGMPPDSRSITWMCWPARSTIRWRVTI